MWISINHKSGTLPESGLLQRWKGEGTDRLVATKMHDVGEEQFENILREFPADFENFKMLARNVHGILFQNVQNATRYGLVDNTEVAETCGAVICAFDSALLFAGFESR